MENELLPCSFCGEAPSIWIDKADEHDTDPSYTIVCENHGNCLNPEVSYPQSMAELAHYLWNKRTKDDKIKEAIQQAADMLVEECPWRDDTHSYRDWYDDRKQ